MLSCEADNNTKKLQLYQSDRDLTLTEVINAPKICNVKDKQAVKAAIISVLVYMLEYFEAKYKLNDMQINAFAEDFIREYPTDSIEDLLYCLRNARSGKYGKDYNRIDSVTIFTWYKEYLNQRLEVTEQLKAADKYQKIELHENVTEAIKENIEPQTKPHGNHADKLREEYGTQPGKEANLHLKRETLESKIAQIQMYAAHYTDDELHKMFLTYEHHGKRYFAPDPSLPLNSQPAPFDELLYVVMNEIEARLEE